MSVDGWIALLIALALCVWSLGGQDQGSKR